MAELDAAYYRRKAEEARADAQQMKTGEARDALLRIAEQFEQLAKRAEAAKGRPQQ